MCKYDSDHAADTIPAATGVPGLAAPAEGGGGLLHEAAAPNEAAPNEAAPNEAVVRDRPVFGEVRIVTDEVFLGQLHTVVMQSAHREPHASLVEHYGLPGKLARVLAQGGHSPNQGTPNQPPDQGTPNQGTPTQAPHQGGLSAYSMAYSMPDGTRAALRSLQAALAEDDGDYVGPPGSNPDPNPNPNPNPDPN